MWEWLKGVFSKLFKQEVEKQFDVRLDTRMLPLILQYENISKGSPPWLKENMKSLGLAGFINDYISRLVTLDVSIAFPETPRGELLQEKADYILEVLQEKVSDGIGGCGLMFKPNGTDIDYISPKDFAITDSDSNGNVTGAVFQSQIAKNKKVYTRLEWHRFEDDKYCITNKCYVAKEGSEDIGRPCLLTEVDEWKNVMEYAEIEEVKYPLFAYFKMPSPNRYSDTPLGVPIWHNCLKELEDFDVAWNRKSDEIFDSTHVTFVPNTVVSYADKEGVNLPRYVKSVYNGNPMESTITEHIPTLLTEQRISDLNSILSVVGMKCGLNPGTFVFNENTGVKTATEIEADQQETIRTIERIRNQLVKSLKRLFYALDVVMDLDTNLPVEPNLLDEIVFDFGDITYNFEEDRNNWWKYRVQGDVPPWKYFVKFEGMSEEEAKQMVEEAQPKTPEYNDFFSEGI